LWFSTEKGAYGLVESGHSLLCHILTTCLMQPQAATPSEIGQNQHLNTDEP
jgi:hypothetical protein